MNNDGLMSKVQQLLETKMVFSIALPANPSVDALAAATSLYMGLVKMGKGASIACATPIDPTSGLVGLDKVQRELVSVGDNLVVSFPYVDGAIDKITYTIEGNVFNLVIAPKEGHPKLDPQKVNYSYKGGKSEVIIVIDAPTLGVLGELYTNQQDAYTGVEIINLDRHLTNASYGSVNIVEKQRSSTSEIVFNLLKALSFGIDKDIASNLYAGILSATNNFTSYSVNADTFEASAQLLKLGAMKKSAFRPSPQTMTSSAPYMPQPMPSMSPRPIQMPQVQEVQPAPQINEIVPDEEELVPSLPKEDLNTGPETVENKEVQSNETTAKEWLKPKIFKSGGLV